MRYKRIVFLGFLVYMNPAFPQVMVRCEGNGETVIYAEANCPPGTQEARQVSPAPKPDAREQQAAQARAKEQSNELKKLQLAQEKEDKNNRIAKARTEKATAIKKAACDRKLTTLKRAEKQAAEATGKTVNSKKERATFLRQAYEADCGKS